MSVIRKSIKPFRDGERGEDNTGFAAYIGKTRIVWDFDKDWVIEQAKEVLKKQTTHQRFVPTVTIFDCSTILNVAFITDDANGVMIHRRSAQL